MSSLKVTEDMPLSLVEHPMISWVSLFGKETNSEFWRKGWAEEEGFLEWGLGCLKEGWLN